MPFRLLVAGLVTVAAATLSAFVGAFAQSLSRGVGVTPPLAVAALTLGALAGALAFRQTRAASSQRRVSPWSWAMFLAFALFALRVFPWLLYQHGDRLEFLSPNNTGDLPRHLLYARYFAAGVPWWPEHPLHSWATLRYYAGIDLFQSLLFSVGVPEIPGLVWVGLLGAAATALALWRWGGAFTIAGFLFSGGLAGFAWLKTGVFLDYQKDLAWKNLALAVFVTQRGFLFALPAGLVLLTYWRERFFGLRVASCELRVGEDPEKTLDAVSKIHTVRNPQPATRNPLPFWLEALLYIALPFFQLYAFLFLSALLGWWLLCEPWRRELRRHVIKLLAVAALPVGAEIWLMTGGFAPAHSFWLKPGWMHESGSFFAFWLVNFGLFAPLALGLFFWLAREYINGLGEQPASPRRRESIDAASFVLPAGLVFAVTCVVMFAPWEWDNTKLMLWSYFVALPFLWERWIARWPLAVRAGVCVALFFSGAVSVIGGINSRHQNRYVMARRSELDGVRAALLVLPRDTRFACSPDYAHPLVLSGRKLAMGYVGALHGYGLDYKELERTLNTLMLGRPDWQRAAARLRVRYVFWGVREKKRYAGSTRPWETDHAPVASGSWGEIYELTTTIGDAAPSATR